MFETIIELLLKSMPTGSEIQKFRNCCRGLWKNHSKVKLIESKQKKGDGISLLLYVN